MKWATRHCINKVMLKPPTGCKSLGVRPLDDSIMEFVEAQMATAILHERHTGQVKGHSFVFRAWGNPPDATHPRGSWQAVVSQTELPSNQEEEVS